MDPSRLGSGIITAEAIISPSVLFFAASTNFLLNRGLVGPLVVLHMTEVAGGRRAWSKETLEIQHVEMAHQRAPRAAVPR